MEQKLEKMKFCNCDLRSKNDRKAYKTPKFLIVEIDNADVITSSPAEKDNVVNDKDDWNIDNWGLNM